METDIPNVQTWKELSDILNQLEKTDFNNSVKEKILEHLLPSEVPEEFLKFYSKQIRGKEEKENKLKTFDDEEIKLQLSRIDKNFFDKNAAKLRKNIDKIINNYLDTDRLIKILNDNPDMFTYVLTRYPQHTLNMLEKHFNKIYPVIQNMSKEEAGLLKETYNEHPVYKGRIPKEIREIISDIERENRNLSLNNKKMKNKENIDI